MKYIVVLYCEVCDGIKLEGAEQMGKVCNCCHVNRIMAAAVYPKEKV